MSIIKNIAFAGGSSGGHVVPISSLITYITLDPELQTPNSKLFWFGERNSMESAESSKLKAKGINLKFVPIVSGRFRRKAGLREWIKNIADLFRFARGIIQSFYNLKKYRINVIFSKGGFVSLPVVIAGRLAGIKIVVHESDSKPGISTRIAANFASKVFLGFPGTLSGGQYVGQILSEELGKTEKLKSGNGLLRRQSMNPQAPRNDGEKAKSIVLVNCGSLGSASVHEALIRLFDIYPELTEDFERHILLGKLNANFRKSYEKYSSVNLYDFVDQAMMGQLYREADLSICRGGSTSLVEQQLFGIKQIIVPIPWTHDQFKNAAFFVETYNDILIDQGVPNWQELLYKVLLEFQGYKKPHTDVQDLLERIEGTKRVICKALLN